MLCFGQPLANPQPYRMVVLLYITAFLVGCRSKDPIVRLKFIELFDDSLPRALASRLQWVLGSQTSPEILADNVATRFKPTPEEEIYHFIIALLSEGLHVSRV
jgi:hypothetical protein